jgi:tetratricopeptide (TPR) repeat protein
MRLDPAYPPQYLLTLGGAYHWTGRYEEAIAAFKKALARSPHLFNAHALLVLSYGELGREEDARAAVTELLKAQPFWSLEVGKLKSPHKDPAVVTRTVDLWHKAGIKWRWPTDNLEALGSMWAGIEATEKGWIAGNVKEGNTQARQFFERAIALDPQYAAAYARLGRTYLTEWSWQWSQDPQTLEKAVTLIQKATALNDSLPWLYRLLAEAYLWQKQYEQAGVVAERALALDLKDADSYVALAAVQNVAGQPEKAVGLILKAMAMNPSAADWYRQYLGFAYYLMGRYKEAAAALQRVLIHAPNELFARLDLAVTLVELRREEQAQAEAAKVLQLEPTFSLAVARQRWPWKDQAGLERYVAALRKAGLK